MGCWERDLAAELEGIQTVTLSSGQDGGTRSNVLNPGPRNPNLGNASEVFLQVSEGKCMRMFVALWLTGTES